MRSSNRLVIRQALTYLRIGSEQTFVLLEPVAIRLGFAVEQAEDLPVLRLLLESLNQEIE